jgi:hypothetical protein
MSRLSDFDSRSHRWRSYKALIGHVRPLDISAYLGVLMSSGSGATTGSERPRNAKPTPRAEVSRSLRFGLELPPPDGSGSPLSNVWVITSGRSEMTTVAPTDQSMRLTEDLAHVDIDSSLPEPEPGGGPGTCHPDPTRTQYDVASRMTVVPTATLLPAPGV